MLYSLSYARAFPLLLLGLLLAWAVHVAAQRTVQASIPETKWLLQRRTGVAALVDPFAAVAALLGYACAGWTPPVEWSAVKGSKRPLVTLLLAGPVANLVAGAAILVGFDHWVTPVAASAVTTTYGSLFLGDFEGLARQLTQGLTYPQAALGIFGFLQVIVGVISLIPVPPLEGGRLLFLFAPKSAGWQKAEYQLVERNIGVVIVLVCLIRISSIPSPFGYLADVITHALAVGLTHL